MISVLKKLLDPTVFSMETLGAFLMKMSNVSGNNNEKKQDDAFEGRKKVSSYLMEMIMTYCTEQQSYEALSWIALNLPHLLIGISTMQFYSTLLESRQFTLLQFIVERNAVMSEQCAVHLAFSLFSFPIAKENEENEAPLAWSLMSAILRAPFDESLLRGQLCDLEADKITSFIPCLARAWSEARPTIGLLRWTAALLDSHSIHWLLQDATWAASLSGTVKSLAAICVPSHSSLSSTFRHEMFKDYKAQRPVTPSGIISQIPIAKEVLEAFKIPVFAKEGVEADDLIATICTLAPKQKEDLEIYILSGDLDNLQLVNENIKVYTLGKGIKDTVIYDINKVRERFGVEPSQMVDFKALTGDPSDNIPGVEGIGKKTAAEIIQKYGSIKNLYKELSTDTAVLKPKVKEMLKQNKESALMSRELAEMKKDVDINFKIEDCRFGNFDQIQVEEIFKKLQFNSLIARLQSLQK